MATEETTVLEFVDGDNCGAKPERIEVVYRVRICKRCGHAACPMCDGTWCDACVGESDLEEGFVKNPECSEAMECVYDEPDSEACVEVSRRLLTKEEVVAREVT